MSFRTNDSQQLSLFDSTINLTAREQKMLESSWYVQFAVLIFDNIDESLFEPLYSNSLYSFLLYPTIYAVLYLILKSENSTKMQNTTYFQERRNAVDRFPRTYKPQNLTL